MTDPNAESILARLTIALPVWNEEEVIGQVLQELADTLLKQHGGKVLLIDDGSTDQTPAILGTWSTRPGISVLTLQHGGKDRALWRAVAECTTEWFGIMDADGQYDPRDFLGMAKVAAHGCDAVWGVRARRHDNLWRSVISKVGRTIKRVILGSCAVRDTGCGIWMARTSMLKPVVGACAFPAGQVHCHLPDLMFQRGAKLCEVNILHRDRAGGTAKFGALNRIRPGLKSLLQAKTMAAQLKRA